MAEKAGRAISGLILILLGVIFLLPSLFPGFLGWSNIWPLFIVLFGAAFLAGWALTPEHDPGLAFVGTGATLVGLFLGLFAWGVIDWSRMGRWWPAFPMIGGFSFLVLWAAGKAKEPGVLVPALGGILTGLIAFAFTMNWVDWAIAARWWPVLLILLGVMLIADKVFRE